ncbi:MAG: hypothetical protein ABIH26_10625 [Candidatus Eisenbacteria bacterium]
MEIVVLGTRELAALWIIALVLPPTAHLVAWGLGRRLGAPPVPHAPRILFLTAASVGTLLWLTATRFSSMQIVEDSVTLRYPPPLARTCTVPLSGVEEVKLFETAFPQRSYFVSIGLETGEVHRSIGLTPHRLDPLYAIFRAFRPEETPHVALR